MASNYMKGDMIQWNKPWWAEYTLISNGKVFKKTITEEFSHESELNTYLESMAKSCDTLLFEVFNRANFVKAGEMSNTSDS